jgi:radical SAM protein with 4Fe4S-binding SPASM domain
LRVFDRDDHRLCLNPGVPAWVVTSPASVLLLRLADGQRSVADITDLLTRNQIPVDPVHVRRFFAEARGQRMFDPPQDRDGGPADAWSTRRLSAMHLHLTDRCNLRCTYCYRNSHPHLPIRHEPSRFVEMLGFIRPFCSDRMVITFCGGEPLTYPGFAEVIRASSRLGFRNVLLTNGTLITDDRADLIRDHFERVQISLDGPDRETHAATRGNNFDAVVRGVRRLVGRGVKVVVQVTATRTNLTAVRAIKNLFPEGTRITFTPMLPMGRGAGGDDEYLTDDEFLLLSRQVAAEAGPQKPRYVAGAAARSCNAGLSNVSVADTGDVYPCHLFHQSAFHLGNIFHDTFEDIFYGPRLREYVREMDIDHNNSVCRQCEVRYLCGGGCKANALHATGDFHGTDLYCSSIKAGVIDHLFESAGVAGRGYRDESGIKSKML